MTKFKQFMQDNDIDIKDFAYEMKLTQATLYGWMAGRRIPHIKSLAKLRSYFQEHNIDLDVIDMFIN